MPTSSLRKRRFSLNPGQCRSYLCLRHSAWEWNQVRHTFLRACARRRGTSV